MLTLGESASNCLFGRVICLGLASGLALASLAACGESAGSNRGDASSTGPSSGGEDVDAGGLGAESPSPALGALEKVLGWVNGAPLSASEYGESFDDTFVAQVSFTEFQAVLEQLVDGRPWTLEQVQEQTRTTLVARVAGLGSSLRVSVSVLALPPHAINGLLFEPAETRTFVPPENRDEAISRLEQLGGLSLLQADLVGQQCMPTFAIDSERQRPIGSAFKLWVLGAVTRAVDAGTLAWAQPVTIRDALDSLPSGTTQDEPDGSTLPARELAERMIALSDNTATDHLMALVGRQAVEQAMTATGHAQPERNLPLLSTRDLFVLKFGKDLAVRDAYLAGDEAARRVWLDERLPMEPLPRLTDVLDGLAAGPTEIERLEWFASAMDLCRAWVSLADHADARAILAKNPGVPASPDGPAWTYLGFKGGSETGVLALAWLHEVDGQRSVTIGIVTNNEAPIDEFEAVQLFAFMRDGKR